MVKKDCFLPLKTKKVLENQGLWDFSEVWLRQSDVMLRIVMLLPLIAVKLSLPPTPAGTSLDDIKLHAPKVYLSCRKAHLVEKEKTRFAACLFFFWLPLLDLRGGVRINSPSERLRCPTKSAGLRIILDFVDRGTHCACALSATGSAQARGYLLRPLSRYSYKSLARDPLAQSAKESQKEHHPIGWCSFWLPLLDLNQRPAD